MVTIDSEGSIIISPPEELVIRTVEDFVKEVQDALSDAKSIFLNLIGVIEIDSAGFQVLVALKNEAKKRDIPLKIIGMSSEADEIIALYGAQSFFEN
ncbi:MAG: STAS domain-containing protein [Sulfurimonas sp.]|jgi:anti-anti-sigma factor